jgi:hypothetical protein
MADLDPTGWAPSQFRGMSCACVSPDATRCLSLRTPMPIHPDGDDDDPFWNDQRCECCCHDRDEDDDWGEDNG